MPTEKVPPYARRNKTIGSAGMTDDLNADSLQIELLSEFANTLPDSYDGGAPQWVAGPQKLGALVYDLEQVYRVKNDILNSQSAPAGNPNNYEAVGIKYWAGLAKSGADPQTIAEAIAAIPAKRGTGAFSGGVGGENVNNSGFRSGSAGGYLNTNSGAESGSVGGGGNNNTGSDCASVGGAQNTNSGDCCTSLGGLRNNNSGQYSASVGGQDNSNAGAYTTNINCLNTHIPASASYVTCVGCKDFFVPAGATGKLYVNGIEAGTGPGPTSPTTPAAANWTPAISRSFDTHYVKVPGFGLIFPAGSCTIEFMFTMRPDTVTNTGFYQVQFSLMSSDTNRVDIAMYYGNGGNYYDHGDITTNGRLQGSYGGNGGLKQFKHWAGIVDIESQFMEYRFDNIFNTRKDAVTPWVPANVDLYLGTRGNNVAALLHQGRMGEVRVWSIARSPAEIANDYGKLITGPRPGLVACWRMDEANSNVAGTVVTDYSGNGHHGVIAAV